MDFHALGRLAVHRNGEPIDLGTPKQKAVLALLLINANQPVHDERIIEEIWGEDSNGKANALRVYVSQLRSALEPGRERGESSVLERQGNGYRLTVDPDHFDVARFERQLARAQPLQPAEPAAAADAFDSALGLWQGPAYDDFAYDDFAQVERARLHEVRITAYEDRIEADLARGLSGELVSELEVLRDEHPLREQLVRHQALALYRAGRPADALRSIDRFRRHIGEELGIDPSPDLLHLEEQILLHDPAIRPRPTELELELEPRPKTEAVNPFKGLRAFTAGDAPHFFGRDALVAELLRNIGQGQRLIAVVGASGSGKSSVVQAGLLPALAKGAIEGSDRWLVATALPGAHPFAELEGALLRSVIDGPANLEEQLRDGDAGLLRAALRILPDSDARLLLVIDQFEELFALVDDESVRHRFLSNLVAAVDDPHDRITVVLTLRADFYARPLQHPQFGARLGNGVVNVTPMTAEELEDAALKPAEQVGVGFEPALLGQLISDVGTQPGALPLFQYALTELFDRRVGDTLQASSYRSMGGLDGALQRRASDLYEQLNPDEKEAARQLFLRLVTMSEHDDRTRRRVGAREVVTLVEDTVTMHDVIQRFGEHRLLSFDADPLTGAPTVEVAHEALLTAWPTLAEWIDDGRDDLRRHAALAVGVREWQLADENPDYLLPATRLAEYRDWSRDSHLTLNAAELTFLDASGAVHEEDRRAEEERRRYETRSRRRLWGLVAALAGGLGIAALFLIGVFAGDAGPTVAFFGVRDDDQWNANIAGGLERAQQDFDVTFQDVPWVVDAATELRDLAESGPKIIVTDELALESDSAIVSDFPDVQFGVVGAAPTADNVTTVRFANEEAAFLAGVAAASKTESGAVGFVGAEPSAAIETSRAAFEAGAWSVDPDTIVLAAFVDQSGAGDGFDRPDLAQARANALHIRNVDVVFSVAGRSELGIFDAAEQQSGAGLTMWAIGLENDRWFEVNPTLQRHVLTSIVKRADVAAYRLVDHILGGGSTGEMNRLGWADDGFRYSTQGAGLTDDMIARLDDAVAELSAGAVEIPSTPTGPVLTVDLAGNEIDEVEPPADEGPGAGVDGIEQFSPIDAGTYDINALGMPITLTVPDNWWALSNIAGETAFGESAPGPGGPGNAVFFFRPTLLADPAQPQAAVAAMEFWPLDDIEGWLENLIDGLVTEPWERTRIGGRDAVYFEAEVPSPDMCGPNPHCVGFVVNVWLDNGLISAWTFDPGRQQRVWWVDGGDQPPLVIISATGSDDRRFHDRAGELLESLVIGEFGRHPADSG